MGRAPCCDKANVKKGPWSPEEDAKLKDYIEQHGTGGNWIALPQKIGLKRCGKSCRLRWLNYLRPNLRHGGFSQEEDNIICSLYISIGSRWSIIAAQLPGRTDNDIKNYWNTRLKKKLLGKQRKEARRSATLHKQQHQLQQQQDHMASVAHHDEGFMAPSSSGHGAMMMMNPTPYWPHHLPPPPCPDQDQDLIKNLLIKLGGRFSEEPNTTHPHQYDTTNLGLEHDQNHLYGDNSTCYFPSPPYDEYMLQHLQNYPVEQLSHELVYGNDHEQPVLDHGVLNTTCYGIHNTINVSSTATATGTSSSESSSNWGTADHVSFPLIMTTVSGYEQQDDAIFQESPYFGLQ